MNTKPNADAGDAPVSTVRPTPPESENPISRIPPERRLLHWNRRLAHWARWLHTYLSMFSFVVILFFAVTGLTLNHADWFTGGHQQTTRQRGTLDRGWFRMSDPKAVAKSEIVASLQHILGIRTGLSDFQVDDVQCEVSFKGPGYEADAIIDRDTGKYDLTVSRFGLVAILNDLHKGRDTGNGWSRLIDFSAIFMALVSLSGLTLIFYLTKRRASGLVAIAIGALLCYLIYAVWVP
jgi:uncharacterized protein